MKCTIRLQLPDSRVVNTTCQLWHSASTWTHHKPGKLSLTCPHTHSMKRMKGVHKMKVLHSGVIFWWRKLSQLKLVERSQVLEIFTQISRLENQFGPSKSWHKFWVNGAVQKAFPARHLRPSGILSCWPGTHSQILSGIQRAAQTVLGIYLKRTCSRITSASSVLGVLNNYALYKSMHSLTDSLTDNYTIK